jgi:hypothetical protein
MKRIQNALNHCQEVMPVLDECSAPAIFLVVVENSTVIQQLAQSY